MGRELEAKGKGVLVVRWDRAETSADLMDTILHQLAESTFCCTSQVMTKNKIVIPVDEIQDGMFDWAA